MPIPKTRIELSDYVSSTFKKLQIELDDAGPSVAELPCAEEWSVKDLLAVRVWWTVHVIDWVEAGRRGEIPVTPEREYRWNETPRLNASIVAASKNESYRSLRIKLERGYDRVMSTIDQLDDRELLETGVFEWAGNYPVSRWISINTARQYKTARAFIRRSLRESR